VYIEYKCDKKDMKYLKLIIDAWYEVACLGWKKITRKGKIL
jgi:hypothetical protein